MHLDHIAGISNSSDDGLVAPLGHSDWVGYEVNVRGAARLKIVVAAVPAQGCKIRVLVDGEPLEVGPFADGTLCGTTVTGDAGRRILLQDR